MVSSTLSILSKLSSSVYATVLCVKVTELGCVLPFNRLPSEVPFHGEGLTTCPLSYEACVLIVSILFVASMLFKGSAIVSWSELTA